MHRFDWMILDFFLEVSNILYKKALHHNAILNYISSAGDDAIPFLMQL